MKKSISKAVKAMMQMQVVSTCGLIQLRRDHHLSSVRGLSVDNVQALRHAPVIGDSKLFPAALLKEMNDANYQSLQTKALLRATRPDTRQQTRNSYRGGHNAGRGYGFNAEYAQRQGNNNFYGNSRCDDSPSVNSCVSPLISKSPARVEAEIPVTTVQGDVPPATSPVIDFEWEEKQAELQREIPVGGRLRFFWKAWREIGASKRLARFLNRGYRLPFIKGGEEEARSLLSRSCPSYLSASYAEGSEKNKALTEMIEDLKKKQVIEVVQETCASSMSYSYVRNRMANGD